MIPVRGSTFAMLVIAVVFGAAAVFLANIWINSQRPSPAVQSPQPAQVEISTIVVAARDLKFGDALKAELLNEIPWPKSAVPEGAFAKIADVTKDGTRVVLNPIGPNEPLLKWKISGPGARATLSALVKEGMRAITVRINDTSGVAGFILPGDRVDVLYTRSDGGRTIDVLLQNVRVLAINQMADEKRAEPLAGKNATLELTPVDAQKISLAQTTGGLTLTLRSAGSLDPAPAQRIVEAELVSNPSVYQSQFDAQAAAQAELDARLAGLEGNLSQIARQVQDSEGGKAALDAKLTDIESKLQGEIAKAGASSDEVRSKLASLEDAVRQTAEATGAGEAELRLKLTALEKAIRQASNATGQGEGELRARLAEFEATLRQMMAGAGQPEIKIVEAPAAAPVKPATTRITVYRGMKDADYTVPLDVTQR